MALSKKLQLNQDSRRNGNESSLNRDILQIEKNIEGIEKNISDLEKQRSMELEEISGERNYDIFFYVGGVLVFLNLIFKFSYTGLFITLVFTGFFVFYKIYFTKPKRATSINLDIDREIDGLNSKIAERQEEIKKIQEKIRG